MKYVDKLFVAFQRLHDKSELKVPVSDSRLCIE
jgi:hypothetical protein